MKANLSRQTLTRWLRREGTSQVSDVGLLCVAARIPEPLAASLPLLLERGWLHVPLAATDFHAGRTCQQKARGCPDPAPARAGGELSASSAGCPAALGERNQPGSFLHQATHLQKYHCPHSTYSLGGEEMKNERESAAREFLANSEVLEGLAAGGLQFNGR